MTDMKRLLSEATPLPWIVKFDDDYGTDSWRNAELIVAAVNRLPDYLAAVQTAQNLVSFCDIEVPYWADIPGQQERWHEYSTLLATARAALARLRDEVPA